MTNHDNLALITTPRLKAQDGGNRETKNFLDCPFEIRAMVYKDFFAAEFYESSEARLKLGAEEGNSQLKRRMTAHHKVSLLLANKAVWEEGLPFFHRLHEFELRIPERCETILTIPLPYQIQQVLRVVAKVRLVDQVEELYDALLDNVGYYVAFLKREFTELKSLKASITLFDCDDHPYAIKQIQQLWPRLNYLQLIVNYVWTGDVETILRSITPGLKWSLAEVHPWDYDSFWRIGVYLDRTHLEEGVTEIDDLGYELP